MRRELLWSSWEEPGIEHLRLDFGADGGWADGVVIGVAAETPFRLRYRVTWDADWRTRSVLISRLASDAWDLELNADGEGRWHGTDGSPLPALDGCIDVDIAATPLTNTLPIRRLDLRPGEAADLPVAYVAVPELTVSTEPQRYTALADDPGDRRYRFESLDGDFAAELTVDADGLVMRYPELFRRI